MGDKGNFQVGIEQQLRQWNTQIEHASQTVADLKEKAGQLEPDARFQYLDHIQEIESKMVAAKARIDEGHQRLAIIKSAGEEAWEEIKIGSQQAWSDLALGLNEAWDVMKTSVDHASSKIKNRIPPK